ncbi:hypothetical protein HPB51_011245 [Rhipicephalus microplus]|uniref:Uncharacterized protein n=1 Tax=Rhipicephalus microplus TaxID=6941 RepID=A0A9J6DMC3_RHIMP|nr:hypothetical protein HPB51_011245 [Rhipicephalus microplus]
MAQSRTTDPDIPASTTLRSGRVLSNSPPITDGVQASTAAPHHDCSEAISRGFSLFAQELKTSGFGCASFGSFNENEIPYFHGFKDDPTNWVMAQSRTTDPDIPASTTLRSGRVLSNSPPITDGVQASTAAPHHDCSEAISRGFSLFAQELKTSGFGCASFGSFNENEIPYFHGFKDDPTNWSTDPDIPASTTLRSGRVLSNSPPITDGVQASTAAPHHDCSEAISRGFSLFAQELKTSGFGCASFGSFNENEIPYFHGFKDDPTNWVSVINSVALKYSWSDTIKKSAAEGRLRGSAQAWHRFQGSTYATWQTWSAALISAFAPLPSAYDDRFMTMRSRRQGATEDVATYIYDKLDLLQACDIQWTSSAARQYIIDGIHDSTHAAVLSAYNHPVHISTFTSCSVAECNDDKAAIVLGAYLEEKEDEEEEADKEQPACSKGVVSLSYFSSLQYIYIVAMLTPTG